MGRYLDIVRKFEAKRQAEGRTEPRRESRPPLQPPVPLAPDHRDFFSRPISQENAPDVWDAWTPFMLWLLERHPNAYHAICTAEDRLNELERQGVIAGPVYDEAWQRLRRRFEDGRGLKYAAECHVWWQ